nr:immunoglobulin light chain junction region [Macaca mulatta]
DYFCQVFDSSVMFF